MASLVNIKSSGEWQSLLSGTNVVVADFYADWCSPCKMIAPHFESLAKQHSQPKKVAFAKVNVDQQADVARTNGVSAMPTFKIFHGGNCIDTIKGANPSALTEAVAKAVKLSGAGKAGDSFKTPGRTLGGTTGGRPDGAPRQSAGNRLMSWDINNFIQMVINMVGLYLVSLLSFDAYKAAEGSPYNIHRPSEPSRGAPGANGARAAPKPAFRTLADLGDKDQ